MSRGPIWSTPDKQLLGRIYPTATKAELLAAFPMRSWCGIGRMAQDLGIKRDPETANAARSESTTATLRRARGSEPGLRQVVIRRPAPSRDSELVGRALQRQPAFLALWVGGTPRPAASWLSSATPRLCGGAQGAVAHGGRP